MGSDRLVDVNGARDVDDGAFVVELDRFTGPLDLLLHLIREQDIDIFDIPISQITAQFLVAINGVVVLGLDRAGEFLEMAALLVRIKAQMILPRRAAEGEVWEDPRAELVRRLLEYEHYHEAALRLEASEGERRRMRGRGYVPPRTAAPVVTEIRIEWDDLWSAALAVGERARPRAEHRVTPRAVPLEDKIGLIVQTLKRTLRVEFARLVQPFGDKQHGVVTLLAGLELAKRRELVMRQRQPFTPLWFYKQKEQTTDAADADR
jgi:segregation and condensation protein A